jgi:hypothetical protein
MKAAALALALALTMPAPAAAHCFRTWHFPAPQRGCAVRLARAQIVQPRLPPAQIRPAPAPAVRPPDPPPAPDEATLRAEALDSIRAALRLRAIGLQ